MTKNLALAEREEKEGPEFTYAMVGEEQDQPNRFSLVRERAFFIWIVTYSFVVSLYSIMPRFIDEFLGGVDDDEEIWSSRRALSLIATHLILIFILAPSLLLAVVIVLCTMFIYTLVFEIV